MATICLVMHINTSLGSIQHTTSIMVIPCEKSEKNTAIFGGVLV